MSNSDQLKKIRREFSQQFIMASAEVVAIAGTTHALFLDNLMSKQEWIEEEGWCLEGGWFYRTLEAQQADTGLGIRTLRRAKRFFQEKGVLQVHRKGAPPKEYYRINASALQALRQASRPQEFREANPCEVLPLQSLRSARNKHCEVQGISNKNIGNNNKVLPYGSTGTAERYAGANQPVEKGSKTETKKGYEYTYENRSSNMKKVRAVLPRKGQQSKKRKEGNPSASHQRVHPRVGEIIQAWNTLPGVSRTRLEGKDGKPTKTLARTQALLTNLLRGKPLVWNMENESVAKLERFLAQKKIDESLLDTKWTASNIMSTLRAALEHPCCPASRPALHGVIWNGFSQRRKGQGFSLFLTVANERRVGAEYRERAQRLAQIVTAASDYHVTDRELDGWATDVRQLVVDHGVSLSNIDAKLAWYAKHCGDAFVPAVFSGCDLLNKWSKLEAAMNRAGQDDTPRRNVGMRSGYKDWKRAPSS